ncbi:Riboflavin transporter [Tsuneonella dongtanensis]|uniref:Riboflavin transporter n=1 Tax=Tsuneonella dongtanensis TaxID=692370 RepID=A0A1B2AGU6_9SPHN|nr:DMT family transporter [Tsuneonella dongtanensis]ANY21360.1 Riboflavin transporter [Tsuneonella dongtanensis]
MTAARSSTNDRSGLLVALAGFALLSVGDAVVKSIAGEWPPTAIAALRYVLGAAGLSAMLLATEGRAAFRFVRPGAQLVRGASVAVATVAFFGSLQLMPLAEATSIVFASPIITAALAPLVLRERTGPATWAACLVAFAGVLIVLRPNLAPLGIAALLPLVSAFAMSALFMANRSVAGSASALAMQAVLALIAAPILILAAAAGHASGLPALAISTPSLEVVAKCAFVALSASSAHWLIYLGTTRAGASRIAPMTYVQLLVATALGWWWFGDRPDAMAVGGAALIIGAGLLLWRWGGPERRA